MTVQKKARKANLALRTVIILFLIFGVSPLACAPLPSIPNPNDSDAIQTSNAGALAGLAAAPMTFTAEVDAQVNEASPSTNAGDSTYLQVDGAKDLEVESFIRFTVTDVSGTIENVRLRVYDTTNASNNGPAVYGTGTSWMESTITWKTRPARMSGELDNKDSIGTNTWVEYDVTSWV